LGDQGDGKATADVPAVAGAVTTAGLAPSAVGVAMPALPPAFTAGPGMPPPPAMPPVTPAPARAYRRRAAP